MNRTLTMTAAMLLALGALNLVSVGVANAHGSRTENQASGIDSPRDVAENGTAVLPSNNGTEAQDEEDHASGSNSGHSTEGAEDGTENDHQGAGEHDGAGSQSHDGSSGSDGGGSESSN